MVTTLRLGRAAFALLMGITSATGTLIASLLPLYVAPMLAVPLVTFSTAIVAVLIVYLGTEEQVASP